MQAADAQGHAQEWTGIRYLLPLALIALCTPVVLDIGGLSLNPLRIVLLVTTAPLLGLLLTGRFGRISAVDGLVLAYTVWQVVAVAVNNPDRVVQFSGANAVDFLGGYLVGRAAIRNPQEFAGFIKLLLFALLVLVVPAFIETQTGRPLIPELLARVGVPTISDVYSDQRLGLERAQVVFSHPIHFGVFASSLLALTVVGLQHQMSLFRRGLGAMLVGISTVFSVSSGALLPLVIQILLIGWALSLWKVQRRWLILASLTAVGYVVIEVLSDRPALVAILTRIAFNAHNVYWRTLAFEYGMQNVMANPVFGLGLRDWIRPYFMFTSSVDNFWLLNAMRYGIPGAAFLILAVVVAMIKTGRRRFLPGSPEAQSKLGWVLAMVSMVLTLFTVHVWGGVYTYLMILVASGHFLITWPATQEAQTEAEAEPARRVLRTTRFPAAEAPAAPVAPPAPVMAREAAPAKPRSRLPKREAGPERRDAPSYTRFAGR